jgi:hypothetical protein
MHAQNSPQWDANPPELYFKKMTNRQKYLIVRDNSCHWYCIPETKKEEWEEFCNIPEDDEASWSPPSFAVGIDGPHDVAFYLD